MSGIAGIYSRNGQLIDTAALQRMTDVLGHRGPDGSGIWHAGSIGFGHRLLWTTPESIEEHLPLVAEDGGSVVTADARIDNRDDLIEALGVTRPREQITDSQLILHAYQRWRERCPEYLLGDFAFAIWNNAERRLFCARDHMGVKPFCYYLSDHLFSFASEPKALFCLPEVTRSVNETQVAFHLTQEFDNRQITAYHDVFRLPAAHSLSISNRSIHSRRYWLLDQEREVHLATDEEYERAFRDIFTEAVRCRLRSAFPVGLSLSGGLDSSSIACVARHVLQCGGLPEGMSSSPLHVFSLISPTVPQSDESFYIDAVLAKGGFVPHIIPIGDKSPLTHIDQILWYVDKPLDLANAAAIWQLYTTAQAAGVRVLMDGEFGDHAGSTFENCMTELVRRRKWRTVLSELRAYVKLRHTTVAHVLWHSVLLPRMLSALANTRAAVKKERGSKSPISRALTYYFIRSEFARRVGFIENVVGQELIDRKGQGEREAQYLTYAAGGAQYDLESLDMLSAARSVDLRHPFLDRRVIEFCLALPPEQKIRGGYTRAIVRRALAAYLPTEVRTRRSKKLSNELINNGLRIHEQKRLEDMFFRNSHAIEEFVDLPRLREEYGQLCQGLNGGLIRAWQVIVLWLWLREIEIPQEIETASK